MKFVLTNREPGISPSSEELSRIILARIGLEPRRLGSTENMHKVFLMLYEKQKHANKEKKPELAVMTVEEMGLVAGITRQTMYDYLKRWLALNMITKTSYIKDGKVIIGYKLNGSTLESAFEKAMQTIINNMQTTQRYIQELQKILKNEKISQSIKEKSSDVSNLEQNV